MALHTNRFNILEKINLFSMILFLLTLVCFTYFILQNIFLNPSPTGDENHYLEDLLIAENQGFGKALIKGASLPYLTLSFLIKKFINNPLLALRVTSLVIGVSTIILLILFERRKIRLPNSLKWSSILWIIYVFIIQTSIFRGINDIVLVFFGSLLWIIFYSSAKSCRNAILLGFILACIMVTRKMAITYLIVFIIVFVVCSRFDSHYKNKNLLIIFTALIILFTFLNSYSLINNQNFSFDDKHLNGEINWAQWEYHNAIMIDQGKQNRLDHVDIEETQLYIKRHGVESLPTNFIEMIFFNPALTIKEFFIDIGISLMYLSRQTGLIIFAFFIILLKRFRAIIVTKHISSTDFIYIFGLIYFLIINFVVITNIQPRWFMVFLPTTILLIIKDLSLLPKKQQLIFSILNNFLLIVMTTPYIWNNL